MSKEIEEDSRLLIDFNKLKSIAAKDLSVVPAVVQNDEDGRVIMLGYVNEQALEETLKSGYAVFWSTSRNEIWRKGETSGDRLKIVEVRINCEQNSLLYKVCLAGAGACHTKRVSGEHRTSCYYRTVDANKILSIDPKI